MPRHPRARRGVTQRVRRRWLAGLRNPSAARAASLTTRLIPSPAALVIPVWTNAWRPPRLDGGRQAFKLSDTGPSAPGVEPREPVGNGVRAGQVPARASRARSFSLAIQAVRTCTPGRPGWLGEPAGRQVFPAAPQQTADLPPPVASAAPTAAGGVGGVLPSDGLGGQPDDVEVVHDSTACGRARRTADLKLVPMSLATHRTATLPGARRASRPPPRWWPLDLTERAAPEVDKADGPAVDDRLIGAGCRVGFPSRPSPTGRIDARYRHRVRLGLGDRSGLGPEGGPDGGPGQPRVSTGLGDGVPALAHLVPGLLPQPGGDPGPGRGLGTDSVKEARGQVGSGRYQRRLRHSRRGPCSGWGRSRGRVGAQPLGTVANTPRAGQAVAVASSVLGGTGRDPSVRRSTRSTAKPSRSSGGVSLLTPAAPVWCDCLSNSHDHQGSRVSCIRGAIHRSHHAL